MIDAAQVEQLKHHVYEPASFEISALDIRKFAIAVGALDQVHFNVEAAQARGYRGIVAPPTFYISLGLASGRIVPRTNLGLDGLPVNEPLAGTRVTAGETVVDFPGEIYAGDTITVVQRLANVYEKQGRSGQLIFLVLERRYVNQEGQTVVEEQYTRIARGADSG